MSRKTVEHPKPGPPGRDRSASFRLAFDGEVATASEISTGGFFQLKKKGNTLQGINISHLGKRKIIFKMLFLMGYVNFLEGTLPETMGNDGNPPFFGRKFGDTDRYSLSH